MKRTSLHTPEYASLVALLRDLRLEAGLSQAEAAVKVDRPQTWLSALEVGGRGLDILHVRELVAVYGLDFAAFAVRLEETITAQPYRPPRRRRVDAKLPAVLPKPEELPAAPASSSTGKPATKAPAKPATKKVAKPVPKKPTSKATAARTKTTGRKRRE